MLRYPNKLLILRLGQNTPHLGTFFGFSEQSGRQEYTRAYRGQGAAEGRDVGRGDEDRVRLRGLQHD